MHEPHDPSTRDWTRWTIKASARLLNLPYEETDAGIEALLGDLGRRVDASRGIVLRVTPDDLVASRSHLWCHQADETPRINGQFVLAMYPYLLRQSLDGLAVAWGRPEDVPPEAREEWGRFTAADGGFRPVVLFPMFVRDRFVGLLSLRGGHEERRVWRPELLEFGHLIAAAIAGLLERTRVEAELRIRETRYRTLTRLRDDAVQVLDAHGICIFTTPGVQAQLDLTDAEAIGRRLVERVHPADRARFEGAFQAALADPSVAPVEVVRMRLPSGLDRPFEARFHNRLAIAAVGGVVVGLRDLQHLRSAERTIALQGALLEAVAQPVVATDLERTIRFWNPAAELLTGWAAHEVFGRSADALGLSGESDAERGAITDAILAGRTWTAEMWLRAHHGERIRVRGTISPLPDADGHLAGSVIALTDLRPQAEIDIRLQRAERLDALTRLADSVVRDLGNGLTALASHFSLLEAHVTPAGGAHLEATAETVTSMARVVRHLRALRRSDALHPVATDVNAVLLDLRDLLDHLLGPDVELLLELAPSMPRAWGDTRLIEVLTVRLAAAARDAMDGTGRLRLATAAVDGEPGVLLEIEHTSRHGLGTTGPGADPEIDALGLSAAQSAVHRLGGELSGCGLPGGGARWTLALRTAPDRHAARAPHGGPPRVLLVEDDDAERARLGAALTEAGFEVVPALSGQDALTRGLQATPSIALLVTPVALRDQGGVALAAELAEGIPGLKVVFTTRHAVRVLTGTAPLGGRTAVLRHPFETAALVEAARKLLD